MVKAFKLYGIEYDDRDQEICNFENVHETNFLPMHLRCVAHTTNLVATTDFKKILENSSFKAIHDSAFDKCSQIWLASRRPKTSEAIDKIIEGNRRMIYPTPTRWNSVFDSVERLMEYEEKLNILLVETQTKKNEEPKRFTSIEIKYLKNYLLLFRPLAKGLDDLQSEKDNFYGDLLPTLFSMKLQLEILCAPESLEIVTDAAKPLLQAFVKRFKNFFDFHEFVPAVKLAIVASISHPKYKLNWFRYSPELKQIAKRIFEGEVSSHAITTTLSAPSTSSILSIFETEHEEANSVSNEINRYLVDPSKDINMLHAFPNIKKIFMKSNVAVCSSAPVERLFSFAGIINSSRRGALSPKNFEELVMLKANKTYAKR